MCIKCVSFQLLEIEAIPLGGREAKRRRKMEQQEAMKEKGAQNAAVSAAAAAAATPDYAAGLGQAVSITSLSSWVFMFHVLEVER